MIHEFYYWCGLMFSVVSSFAIFGLALAWVYEKTVNRLADVFKNMWVMLEYQFYKKEFKEWVKDKPRHPKMGNRPKNKIDLKTVSEEDVDKNRNKNQEYLFKNEERI